MNSPADVHIVTEFEVYEASVHKVLSRGNLNESPLVETKSYSWSDVEVEESKKEEPKVEQPKVEQPKVQEFSAESINERLDKLMTEISNIVENNIKVDVELDSEEEEMSTSVDDSDMPDLISDVENETPSNETSSNETPVSDASSSDTPTNETPEIEYRDDLMVAVFRRPSCARCEATLKAIMEHEDASSDEYDEDENEDEDEDEDEEEDVSSDEEVDPRRFARTRRGYRTSPHNTFILPPLMKFMFMVVVILHIIKYLINEAPQYNRYIS